jgi:hypothetical protein
MRRAAPHISAARSLTEGAAFQLAFTAIAVVALGAWTRVCAARRTDLGRR